MLNGEKLKVLDKEINLSVYERVFLLGFGKGSAKSAAIIEKILGDKLTGGYVIDVAREEFAKIEFTLGTHPLPSQANIDFTKKIASEFSELNKNDLVIAITCGGGSALLELPTSVSLETLIEVGEALLKSGADIGAMNVVRKHFSQVKGGGLAKIISPAHVLNLVFSDVPGNDLSVIASGPTVYDPTTKEDAWQTFCKYKLDKKLSLKIGDFNETPKEKEIFGNVDNVLFLSNLTALDAMDQKARKISVNTFIFTDHFQGEAKAAGLELVAKTEPNSVLLVGGETTVEVSGGGQGGRNLELVLAALKGLSEGTVIASFDSDGWDNCDFAGAIGDTLTLKRAQDLNLDPQIFLNGNDSLNFFKQTGDGIETGRLPANVSDLMIVYKK